MFTDVMVDVETTGTTSFDHTAVIQIGAVKFNYDTEAIDTNFFNMSLSIPPNRYWDAGTKEWWSKQKPHILQGILANGQDAGVVIKAFYQWLLQDYPQTDEGLRWWSKPTHFDYSFMASYFNQYGLTNPCHFRYARDMNSFMAGLSGSASHPQIEKTMDFDGDEHNALYDSIHQIKLLFAQKQRFQPVEVFHAP